MISYVDYVAGLPYPECAVSINGTIFEDAIPGYRTLKVEGRDNFSHSIFDYSSRRTRGSVLNDVHEDSKDITVTFAMHSESAQDLRKKFNEFRAFLRSFQNREAQIIFNDEEDVFYVGTVTSLSEEKLVTIEHSAGQFTIHCADPYKYSVEEIEVNPEDDTFIVEYEGGIPSYPTFEATMHAKTKYIAFLDQNEHILQIGTPPDDDSAQPTETSESRISESFTSSIPSGWARNNAVVPDSIMGFTQHGTIASADRGAYPSSYGTYDPETMEYTWHGPSMTKQIPNSSSGDVGAENWIATSKVTMWQNTPTAQGLGVTLWNRQEILICDSNYKLMEKTVVKVPFTAFEGSKRIPAKVTKLSILGIAPKTLDSTAKSDGYIEWTIPKGSEIVGGSITLTFTLTTSTGTNTVTKTFTVVRWALAASGANGVFVNLHKDTTSLIVITGTDNKTKTEQTLSVTFSGVEGGTAKKCQVGSVTLFGITPKRVTGNSDTTGSISWTIPKGTTISGSYGTFNLTFTVTSSSGNKTFTKTITWQKETLALSASTPPKEDQVKVIFHKRNLEFNVYPTRKPWVTYTIVLPISCYAGLKRVAGKITSVDFLGQKCSIVNPTDKADGSIQWVIPRTYVANLPSGNITVNVTVEYKHNNKVTSYKRMCVISWKRIIVPRYETNKIKQFGGKTSFTLNCDSKNKTLRKQIITVPIKSYGGTERLAAEVVNNPKILGVAPTIKNPTATADGYIKWEIPASKAVGSASGTSNVNLRTLISQPEGSPSSAVYKSDTIAVNWERYSMAASRKEYSQLGKLVIEVSGTDQFGDLVSIAAIHFSKQESSSSNCRATLYVNSKSKKVINFKAEQTNKYTGTNKGKSKTGSTVSIQKNKTKYIFTVGGEKYQYTDTNEFTATEVSVVFYKCMNGNELERNSVKNFKFVSNPSDAASYIKEEKVFYNGDTVEVDTRTGQIMINGVVKYGYGALGNDWEEFVLNPGLNQIQCVCTDGVTSPTFKMRYREVY